jgi:hypothetical protein
MHLTTALTGAACAQYAPPVFPPNTVFGRLNPGSPDGQGEAIPFAALAAQLGVGLGTGGTPISSVMNFAAGINIGNGVTDAYPAFNAAFAALSAAGGGWLYVPAGTYNFASGMLTPPSNVIVQGAGVDATIAKNTALYPNSTTININMAMSGTPSQSWASVNTTYPINAPTLGATTVTTRTAANAGNFSVGDIIFITGDLHGTSFWGWGGKCINYFKAERLMSLDSLEVCPVMRSRYVWATATPHS